MNLNRRPEKTRRSCQEGGTRKPERHEPEEKKGGGRKTATENSVRHEGPPNREYNGEKVIRNNTDEE